MMRSTLVVLAFLGFPFIARAENAYPAPGGSVVPGMVPMCRAVQTGAGGLGGANITSPGQMVPCGDAGSSLLQPATSQPTETTTPIAAASTNFGTPGNYKGLTMQAQGQPMCVTFGTGTLAAPTGGVCATGMYLAAGAFYSYGPNAVPSSQGKAFAPTTGGYLWLSVQ